MILQYNNLFVIRVQNAHRNNPPPNSTAKQVLHSSCRPLVYCRLPKAEVRPHAPQRGGIGFRFRFLS